MLLGRAACLPTVFLTAAPEESSWMISNMEGLGPLPPPKTFDRCLGRTRSVCNIVLGNLGYCYKLKTLQQVPTTRPAYNRNIGHILEAERGNRTIPTIGVQHKAEFDILLLGL